jgi:hypothetical protein
MLIALTVADVAVCAAKRIELMADQLTSKGQQELLHEQEA